MALVDSNMSIIIITKINPLVRRNYIKIETLKASTVDPFS